jgi:hypothetical protein
MTTPLLYKDAASIIQGILPYPRLAIWSETTVKHMMERCMYVNFLLWIRERTPESRQAIAGHEEWYLDIGMSSCVSYR